MHWEKKSILAKVVPLPKSKDKNKKIKKIQLIIDQYHFLSLLSKLLEKHVHIHLNDYLENRNSFTHFILGLDIYTPATLHWHALQILC